VPREHWDPDEGPGVRPLDLAAEVAKFG
jgi:hypothetical protein